MKRIVRLTESDLTRIVRRVISEQTQGKINIQGKMIPVMPKNGKVKFTYEGQNFEFNCAKSSNPEVALELWTTPTSGKPYKGGFYNMDVHTSLKQYC